jgi:hypothetical protein
VFSLNDHYRRIFSGTKAINKQKRRQRTLPTVCEIKRSVENAAAQRRQSRAARALGADELRPFQAQLIARAALAVEEELHVVLAAAQTGCGRAAVAP